MKPLFLFSLLFASTILAAPTGHVATSVDHITAPEGFKVELLYSVPGDQQGSWVNLCSDDKGRIYASDQYGATPATSSTTTVSSSTSETTFSRSVPSPSASPVSAAKTPAKSSSRPSTAPPKAAAAKKPKKKSLPGSVRRESDTR